MRIRCLAVSLLAVFTWFGALRGADAPSLDPHLEPLRPWLGKTWRGEFKDSTPEKPVVDVALWERALNGKAVRITHSINDGSYGGETLMIWDEAKKTLKYHYFTTAGFTTEGTITVEGAILVTHEKVAGACRGRDRGPRPQRDEAGWNLSREDRVSEGKAPGFRAARPCTRKLRERW